jgi:hypothetical protein
LPLPVITHASVTPASSSTSKTAGSSFDTGVGRNWLSMTIATLLPPSTSSRNDGPATGLASASRAASAAFATGAGSSG